MKTPPDVPKAEGDRIRHRGRVPERVGVVLRIVPPGWFWVRWDSRPAHPMLCHPNELQVIKKGDHHG